MATVKTTFSRDRSGMHRINPLVSSIVSSIMFGAVFAAPAAQAHIELLEPASRYPSDGNKSCPCGQGDSNSVCSVPAEESSDPNRSSDPDKITVLEAGATIIVKFDEYIGHAGRFRVAFDDDGADLADFNDHVLADIPDPSDSTGMREIEVTLPDTPCENCTLQLIQAMHGDTENPVADPASLSTYYACADIVLVPKGSSPSGPSQPVGDSMAGNPDTGIDAGMPAPQVELPGPQMETSTSPVETPVPNDEAEAPVGPMQMAASAGSAADGPQDATTSTPATNQESTESSGGCRVVGTSADTSGLWGLVAAGSALLLRRRRARQGRRARRARQGRRAR